MDTLRKRHPRFVLSILILGMLAMPGIGTAFGQTPTINIPDLAVRTVVSGLTTPTSMAFLGPQDFFVAEKNTGRVLRIKDGIATTVLDLGVNFASERGLLGIALHPNFPSNPGVYLFWTCIGDPGSPMPIQQTCSNTNMFAPDTDGILNVPLLGNRVDRFEWNGTTLTHAQNLIVLRAYQN